MDVGVFDAHTTCKRHKSCGERGRLEERGSKGGQERARERGLGYIYIYIIYIYILTMMAQTVIACATTHRADVEREGVGNGGREGGSERASERGRMGEREGERKRGSMKERNGTVSFISWISLDR